MKTYRRAGGAARGALRAGAFLLFLGTAACSGCGDARVTDTTSDTCELDPSAPGCAAACPNTPEIVRVTFEPKQGYAPFEVTFDVTAEDFDTKTCGEKLTYHWDFDGDGVEETPTNTGVQVKYLYELPGTYRAKLWATDSAGNKSTVVEKYIQVFQNRPPVIISINYVPPSKPQGYVGTKNSPQVTISADDPDSEDGIVEYSIDWGDGSPVVVEPASAVFTHTGGYTAPGKYTISATVKDKNGAVGTKTTVFEVLIRTAASQYFVTDAFSADIVFDDNQGARYWDADAGEFFEYAYVADGPVALKTFKYYASNFEAGALTRPKLVGTVNPLAGTGFYAYDATRYAEWIAVAGPQGLLVFNANTNPGLACDPGETAGCYPGKPEKPVPVCKPGTGEPVLTWTTANVIGTAFVRPTGSNQVWLAYATGTATVPSHVGFYRIDQALSPTAFTEAASRCWRNTALSVDYPHFKYAETGLTLNQGRFTDNHLYVSVQNQGAKIYDIRGFLACNGSPIDCMKETANLGLPASGGNFAYAAAEPITGAVIFKPPFYWDAGTYPQAASQPNIVDRKGATINPPTAATPGSDACTEWRTVSAVSGNTLTTNGAILRGNRVAFKFSDGMVVKNGATGFLVTGNTSTSITLEALPPRPEADFVGAKVFPVPDYYGFLPGYPGKTTEGVTLHGDTADIAWNSTCSSYVHVYGPMPGPVTAALTTAPMAYVVLETFPVTLRAIDVENPGAPIKFGATSASGALHASQSKLFRWGNTETHPISVYQTAHPWHFDHYVRMNAQTIGGTGGVGFLTRSLQRKTTPERPDGIWLAMAQAHGLRGFDVASQLYSWNDTSRNLTATCATGLKCVAPALTLEHGGLARDIRLVGQTHAVIAQRNGGVAVYDIASMRSGGAAELVAHVPTNGDPRRARFVRDTNGDPEYLYVADTSHFYRIPFTDPAAPDVANAEWWGSSGQANYDCAAVAGNYVFACWADKYLRYGTGTPTPSQLDSTDNRLVFYKSKSDTVCDPDLSAPFSAFSYSDVFIDTLAGRTFLFGPPNHVRELFPNGEPQQGCYYASSGASKTNVNLGVNSGSGDPMTYQRRSASWKRAYSGNASSGYTYIFDIAAMESDMLQGNALRTPTKLGQIDVKDNVTKLPAGIRSLVALGDYLFVAAGSAGLYVYDVSDPAVPEMIATTKVKGTSTYSTNAVQMNVIAYPLGGGLWEYMALVSDDAAIGGGLVRAVYFPGLKAP